MSVHLLNARIINLGMWEKSYQFQCKKNDILWLYLIPIHKNTIVNTTTITYYGWISSLYIRIHNNNNTILWLYLIPIQWEHYSQHYNNAILWLYLIPIHENTIVNTTTYYTMVVSHPYTWEHYSQQNNNTILWLYLNPIHENTIVNTTTIL